MPHRPMCIRPKCLSYTRGCFRIKYYILTCWCLNGQITMDPQWGPLLDFICFTYSTLYKVTRKKQRQGWYKAQFTCWGQFLYSILLTLTSRGNCWPTIWYMWRVLNALLRQRLFLVNILDECSSESGSILGGSSLCMFRVAVFYLVLSNMWNGVEFFALA